MGYAGPPHGVAIDITKRVPMAAGLGGGSSDAASALRGLCALWGFSPGTNRLRHLAAGLGADVPFFLFGGLALGTGRGDVLRQLRDMGRFWVVLAVPRFEISSRGRVWMVRQGVAGCVDGAAPQLAGPSAPPDERPRGDGHQPSPVRFQDGRSIAVRRRGTRRHDWKRINGLRAVHDARSSKLRSTCCAVRGLADAGHAYPHSSPSLQPWPAFSAER